MNDRAAHAASIDNQVGDLLYQLHTMRAGQGLTRAMIAADLETTSRCVQQWETGDRPIRLLTLGAYAACVGLQIRLTMTPRAEPPLWENPVVTVRWCDQPQRI